MQDRSVIVSEDTSTEPEMPPSHPPTPKFVTYAMTQWMIEQAARAAAQDRRMDGQDGRIQALESRLTTCERTALAAVDGAARAERRAEHAIQKAEVNADAIKEPPSEPIGWVGVVLALIAMVPGFVWLFQHHF